MVALFWDAISDPLVAYVSDRYQHKVYSFWHFCLIGVPLVSVLFVSLFSVASLPAFKLEAMFVLMLLFRTAYTLIDIPHNSLITHVTKDGKGRSYVATMRLFFSGAGKLIVTLLAAYLIANEAQQTPENFSNLAWIIACLFVVSIMLCAISVTHIRFDRQGPQSSNGPNIVALVFAIADSVSIRRVFILSGMNSLLVPMIGACLIYYSKYQDAEQQWGSFALSCMAASQAISLFAWLALSKRKLEKLQLLALAYACLLVAAIAAAAFSFSALGGNLLAVLSGFAIAGIFMLNWSLLPDAIETVADEYQCFNMSIYGLYTLLNKVAMGVSQLLMAVLISLFGFDNNVMTAADVAEPELFRIAVFIVVATGCFVCLSLCWHKAESQRHSA